MVSHKSRYVRVAELALSLADETFPQYAHPKSPHRYTLPQRIACVLMMFYLKLSYRDMEEWLYATDHVCAALRLHTIPDYSTLQRTYRRFRHSHIDALQRALLGRLHPQEEVIAADSTGFRFQSRSAYYQTRRGVPYREWLKGAYAVGTASQLVLAQLAERGPSIDAWLLRRLRREAGRYGRKERGRRAWLFLLDAGFDGAPLAPGDLVPVVRRAGQRIAPARQARQELVSAARLDGVMGQRWLSETVHSVIKRKFGDTIRSRQWRRQQREALMRGLVYNLHRVHSAPGGTFFVTGG
jgi:hypothetical protein